MDIDNESTREVRSGVIQVKYDYVPKYCEECKMQGHGRADCRVLIKNKSGRDKMLITEDKSEEKNQVHHNPWVHRLQNGKARILSSGKVVGDPGKWNVVKDRKAPQVLTKVENRFGILKDAPETQNTQTTESSSSHNNIPHEKITDKQEEINNKQHDTSGDKGCCQIGVSAKDWVTKAFGKSQEDVVKSPVVDASVAPLADHDSINLFGFNPSRKRVEKLMQWVLSSQITLAQLEDFQQQFQ